MIEASNLTKRYPGGLEAVKDASFRIDGGQMVLITGHSGAGKTTLVKLISTIERPTSGSLVVNGQNLTALRRSALPHVRRHFGLVFQDQKLLFDRNALDNVLLPLQIAGLPHREAVCIGGGVRVLEEFAAENHDRVVEIPFGLDMTGD